ncbi:MAG: hypothetical protein HZC41_24570 [Chloroflexi bacterium]|nr:hypothetical protein [Chloroflexota bacterium]
MNEELRYQLLRMQADDLDTRRRLIDAGQLYGPHLPKDHYHPDMATVHSRNNALMRGIIEQYGWPGRSLVGDDGGEAAWLVVQHAILDPELQERCLPLLEAAYKAGEVPGRHLATLTDRVRMQKGEPQIYGSILVGDDNGQLIPWTIDDPEQVDKRRAAMGLPPMAEHLGQSKERVDLETKVQQAATIDDNRSKGEME